MSYLSRYNGWLPSNYVIYNAFIEEIWNDAKAKIPSSIPAAPEMLIPAGLSKIVQKFGDTIDKSEAMRDLFLSIFAQASQPQSHRIKDFTSFLCLLDIIVSGPPRFQVAKGVVAEPIGVPMYLLFDILSNTAAAHQLFCMKEFNDALEELLNGWGKYLRGKNSKSSLHNKEGGWFSPAAIDMLEVDRGRFNDTYVVPNPDAPDRGFESWDDFFTRAVQSTARPLETTGPGLTFPEDGIIFNACESTVERWRHGVKVHDRFWLKGMPYSLYDMFKGSKGNFKPFEGGTVYQAFLSPQDYHRWHSPVAGTIISADIVRGSYYAVLPDKGIYEDEGEEIDARGALIRCQPWLTANATRAVFTIEADNPRIGLFGFIAVGMAEVSTCEIKAHASAVGRHVDAGQELGMFHFGGSSYAVIFRQDAKVRFLKQEGRVQKGKHIQVNKAIGVSVV